MSEKVVVEVVLDDEKLEKAKREGLAAAAQIATALRRTVQLGVFTAQAIGLVIDETFRASIEAGLQIIEFTTAALAASSLTPFGMAQSAFKIASIMSLVLQVQALRKGRLETARRLGNAESALDMLTF